MTDIKLEIQSGKLGSKTKVANKKITTVAEAAVDIMSELNKLDHAPIDYAERLFKIKQLEHKRWLKVQDGPFDEPMREVEEIDIQISKLLED